jgi:hypothetical protein
MMNTSINALIIIMNSQLSTVLKVKYGRLVVTLCCFQEIQRFKGEFCLSLLAWLALPPWRCCVRPETSISSSYTSLQPEGRTIYSHRYENPNSKALQVCNEVDCTIVLIIIVGTVLLKHVFTYCLCSEKGKVAWLGYH